ncbi:PadR family transcriptional regulator [Cohnella caldifontis]|uniref:PadR family transcriptional regulator n=1 Tax=Cohnella caldifontis TaxID=3027471 RepID=UPI0023EC8C2D|nr:PadR family transcriptional regulator [Cohnella sp. YIM B05605]
MKLLVLGMLLERDRHPYDIRQTIKERNWNETFHIRDGSLYYAVDQMKADGWIEAAEVIPVPGEHRPDKTVYRITEIGRQAFLDLLYGQLEQAQQYPSHSFFPALPFVRHADISRVGESVVRQLEACEARIERMRCVIGLKEAYLPRGSVHLLRGILRFTEAERDWLRDLLTDAESGALGDPGWSPKRVAEMQEMMKRRSE